MKPSTIFTNWIKANSARIASESAEFQHTIATVSLTLDMLELNRNRATPAMADSAKKLFEKFQAEITARGWAPPAIKLSKIKIITPKPMTGGHSQ